MITRILLFKISSKSEIYIRQKYIEEKMIFITIIQKILGDKNKNLPKNIRVLCKVYDSKYSNKDVDKKIQTIISEMKNRDLMEIFHEPIF